MVGGPGAREKLDFAPFEAAVEESRKLRFEALALDDDNFAVHLAIGFLMLYWEDDFESARLELERGYELDKSTDNGPRSYSTWLKIADRVPEAIELMRRAVAINPNAAANFNALGDVLMTAGRYDEAIERLEIACHRAGRGADAAVARRSSLAQRGQEERLAQLGQNIERLGWAAARGADGSWRQILRRQRRTPLHFIEVIRLSPTCRPLHSGLIGFDQPGRDGIRTNAMSDPRTSCRAVADCG
jgi:tetratricopeptide (TPR) repeat protein